MKEIEILFKINNKLNDALEKLKHIKFGGLKEIIDIYYHNPSTKKCSPNEKNELIECFRIRKKNEKIYLTYKFDHFEENNKWIYSDEYETEIKDFEHAQKIIENLGFIELCRIKNKKYTFSTEDYEIILEEVENLGVFLEVEKLNIEDNEDVLNIKKEIQKFVKSLGIKNIEEISQGKLELMLNKIQKITPKEYIY